MHATATTRAPYGSALEQSLAALAGGNLTTFEFADVLDITRQCAAERLCRLHQQGRVVMVRRAVKGTRGRPATWGLPTPENRRAADAETRLEPYDGDCHLSTGGHLHELGPVALRAKLRHAEEQLTYWQGARFRALHEREKTAAGARVLLWTSEVEAIRRRMHQLAL